MWSGSELRPHYINMMSYHNDHYILLYPIYQVKAILQQHGNRLQHQGTINIHFRINSLFLCKFICDHTHEGEPHATYCFMVNFLCGKNTEKMDKQRAIGGIDYCLGVMLKIIHSAIIKSNSKYRPRTAQHCSDVAWSPLSLKLPTTLHFLFNSLSKLTAKNTSKLLITDPLWGKSNGDGGFLSQRSQ